jgi:hypothetical protein
MSPTGDTMQIHLCKPGGQQEGPYTLEQIKQDLAVKKYSDTDYWAWHEGLPEWVPLYLIPGLSVDDAAAAAQTAAPEPEEAEAPVSAQAARPAAAPAAVSTVPEPAASPGRPVEVSRIAAPPAPLPTDSGPEEPAPIVKLPTTAAGPAAAGPATLPAAPVPEPEVEPGAGRAEVFSGMPPAALEHVFMFTTGDGPSAWQSPTVARMLREIVGEDLGALRESIERDVVAWCAVSELLKPDGSVSDSVWRAMAAHRPELIRQARERLYRVCVRTFRIDAATTVALVLFYNKQKL